jgi:hypothetical protein
VRYYALHCVLLALSATQAGGQQTIAGETEAIAAAERLLERVGGRDVWVGVRTLHVRERAYHLRFGGPLQADFWRDFDQPAYHSRVTGAGLDRTTAWDTLGGWRVREGVFSRFGSDELAMEIAGSRREPYRIYRALARRDAALRVSLQDGNRLVFSDRGGLTVCWFVLDASGAPLKWGNVYDGRVNEHTYGPLVQFGSFRMPAWGTSADGSWRFEYVAISASSETLRLPAPPPNAR